MSDDNATSINSTMTRERAIEIARQAAAHQPPIYYAEPFEPHEWVIGAIMNAAHFAVAERFDASVLIDLVNAWIDLPSPGTVPNGYGEPLARLVEVVGRFIGRDELLKQPDVQKRTEIATAKARVEWLASQLRMAVTHDLVDESDRLKRELREARVEATSLGILVHEDPSLGVRP